MAGFKGLFVRAGTVGTQPVEARKSLAGLLVPSSVVGARQGILPAPGDPLRVTGTAGWEYSVNGGHVATSRSDADGSTLFGSDGTTLTPAVAAAPGSGSRYDLIYVRHLDPDQGEGDPAVVVGVVSGTASGTPVRPAVPAGAVVVAEALMAAGATSTSHANVTITQVLGKTVARGGVLPVANEAERDALAKYPGLTVYRIDTGVTEVSDGTAWAAVSASNPAADGAGVIKVIPGVLHMGVTGGSTDASGELSQAHELGAQPRIVVASPLFVSDPILGILKWNVFRDATNVKIITIRDDTGARFAGQPIPFYWIALR